MPASQPASKKGAGDWGLEKEQVGVDSNTRIEGGGNNRIEAGNNNKEVAGILVI